MDRRSLHRTLSYFNFGTVAVDPEGLPGSAAARCLTRLATSDGRCNYDELGIFVEPFNLFNTVNFGSSYSGNASSVNFRQPTGFIQASATRANFRLARGSCFRKQGHRAGRTG
jgi:hypothetical protein